MSVNRYKPWSDKELKFLKKEYNNYSIKELMIILDRPRFGVYMKARAYVEFNL